MLEILKCDVMNFDNSIRGMRNPLESWDDSDSYYCYKDEKYIIGDKDLKLALKLVKAGTDHSKFMRQIFVSINVNAPLYFFKEFDTYKIATVANSTSSMHTLHKKEITSELFSVEDLDGLSIKYFQDYCAHLEILRKVYLESNDKSLWRQLIQMLPSSFNQMRTCTGNYQVLRNIYHARRHHKMQEWHTFCDYIEKLPYSILITCRSDENKTK